jgi:hypothetical protein
LGRDLNLKCRVENIELKLITLLIPPSREEIESHFGRNSCFELKMFSSPKN